MAIIERQEAFFETNRVIFSLKPDKQLIKWKLIAKSF